MGLLFVYARVVQRRGPSDAAPRLSFLGWARIPTPEKDGNLCSVAVRIGSGLSCDIAHIIQPKQRPASTNIACFSSTRYLCIAEGLVVPPCGWATGMRQPCRVRTDSRKPPEPQKSCARGVGCWPPSLPPCRPAPGRRVAGKAIL
jgi:hypothetical protein